MSIRLRVAGIYFDEDIDFDLIKAQRNRFWLPGRTSPTSDLLGNEIPPNAETVTILELMEAARLKLASAGRRFNFAFDRRFDAGRGFLSMISIGHELTPAITHSLGGKPRAAGFYELTETPIPNGVVAWQNYVLRNGVAVSSLKNKGVSPPRNEDGKSNRGFTTFDQAVIENNDEVIWRMVAIRRVPDPTPAQVKKEELPVKA